MTRVGLGLKERVWGKESFYRSDGVEERRRKMRNDALNERVWGRGIGISVLALARFVGSFYAILHVLF